MDGKRTWSFKIVVLTRFFRKRPLAATWLLRAHRGGPDSGPMRDSRKVAGRDPDD
jgi:hypothetical protein